MYADFAVHTEMVALLLELGADPNIADTVSSAFYGSVFIKWQ
jgi:ankyrin repeat protein